MTSAGAPRHSRRPRRAGWVVPLVAGLCFGLGYAITDRLLNSGGKGAGRMPIGLAFETKPFPGTSLETLRMRYGEGTGTLRGDLEALELEQARKQEEAKRLRQEQEDRRAEAEAAARPSAPEPPLQELPPAEPRLPESRPVEPALPPPPAPAAAAPQP